MGPSATNNSALTSITKTVNKCTPYFYCIIRISLATLSIHVINNEVQYGWSKL